MYRKTQFITFITILISLIILSGLHFLSCAGSKPKELTPEQKQALQDSLNRAHRRELALKWSLGYEPYKQGDYAKAKKYFKQVADKDTSGIYGKILYQMLGDSYLRLNQPDSAEWSYQIGVNRLPDNPYFYNALGYIYRAGGRTDEAIAMYRKLTILEPDSAGHFKILGELYFNNEDQENAVEAYRNATRLNPTDTESQEMLTRLLRDNIDEVIELQKGLVEQEPDNMKYRLDLAQTYHRAGRFENAIEHLKIITGKETTNMLALELLGDSYQQLDQYGNAINIFNKILQIKPDDKKNICNLAMSHAYRGQYTIAMREVRKALNIDMNYGLAYLTRGIIYETAAEKCVQNAEGKINFDDKLVYELAYKEYEKAKRDLAWKSDAERRMNYLQNLIPTREDRFMHKNKTMPEGDCYSWIR